MKFLPAVSDLKAQGHKGLIILVDPDKSSREDAKRHLERILPAQPNFIFVGGSLLTRDALGETISMIKSMTEITRFTAQASKFAICVIEKVR